MAKFTSEEFISRMFECLMYSQERLEEQERQLGTKAFMTVDNYKLVQYWEKRGYIQGFAWLLTGVIAAIPFREGGD